MFSDENVPKYFVYKFNYILSKWNLNKVKRRLLLMMHITTNNTLDPEISKNRDYKFLNALWIDRAITRTHRTLFISKISESMALGFANVILETQIHLENISTAVDREPTWTNTELISGSYVHAELCRNWLHKNVDWRQRRGFILICYLNLRSRTSCEIMLGKKQCNKHM